jgi:hypothetical protein
MFLSPVELPFCLRVCRCCLFDLSSGSEAVIRSILCFRHLSQVTTPPVDRVRMLLRYP